MNRKIDYDKRWDYITRCTDILQFGSLTYGTHGKDSDYDLIILLPTTLQTVSAPTRNRSCQQYTDKNSKCDEIFTDQLTFAQDIIEGASVVNYEAVYFCNNSLDPVVRYIKTYIEYFRTSKLVKAYLGLAERDFKEYNKTDKLKKLNHAVRCATMAINLMNNEDLMKDVANPSLSFMSMSILKEQANKLPTYPPKEILEGLHTVLQLTIADNEKEGRKGMDYL